MQKKQNMSNLQSKIGDINLKQKEEAIEERAKGLGFNYVDFSITKIQLESLKLIPEEIAKELNVVCFFSVQKKIRIAVVNENNLRIKDYIEKLKGEGYNININLCSEEGMQLALSHYDKIRKVTLETKLEVKEDEIKKDLKKEINNELSSEHDILNDIYKKSIEYRASDIHLEITETSALVRFRIDGSMQKYKNIDLETYKKIIRIMKNKANLILNVESKAQEGQYYFEINNRKIDLRVSVLPTHYGESIVCRILDSSKGNINFEDLGFLPLQIDIINKILEKKSGIILTSGPTGSGKTSTLYSFLNKLNTSDKKIITLEDPIEYRLDGIVQSQISEEFDFNKGLIACLRQDPDVLMLGEIREKHAARTAMQAAITGHLVLSTIHTNSAIESIFRLKDLGVENYLIATSLILTIGQRLVRKNCPHCKQKREIKKEYVEYIKSLNINIGLDINEIKEEYFSPGCEKCLNTGYLGREVIGEFVVFDKVIQDFIFKDAPLGTFLDYLNHQGFVSMEASAIVQAIKGIISFDEAYKIILSNE